MPNRETLTITRTMSEFEMLYEFLLAQYSQSFTKVPTREVEQFS